jgi:nucleoside-triphosphatase
MATGNDVELSTKNVVLTGPPGCGKTTVMLWLVALVGNLRLAGFHTRNLRAQGQRAGFEAVGLSSGLRCVLAHATSSSRVHVGRYGVEPGRLDPLVRAELEKPLDGIDAFVIDEIGKMELQCQPFIAAARRLLDSPRPVVATVSLKGQGLIADVKGRADVCLLQVSVESRDSLPDTLAVWLQSLSKSP